MPNYGLPELIDRVVLKRGYRLSIMRVESAHWHRIADTAAGLFLQSSR